MKITKKSIISGIERTLDLPITEEQLYNWKNGMLIQRAMPQLTPSQREFLITGMTDEEWNKTIGEDDDLIESDFGSSTNKKMTQEEWDEIEEQDAFDKKLMDN